MLNKKLDPCLLSQEQLLHIIFLQTKVVEQGLDLSSIMSFVVEESQKLTDTEGAVIELAEDDDMVYRAVSGIAEQQLGLRVSIRGSLSGLCVTSEQILICHDSELDGRVDKIACRKVGLRSMLVAPLICQNKSVGVLKIMSKKIHAFGEVETQIITLLSEVVAASMHTALKYEKNELYRKATTDELTGVSNRALFFDRLRLAIGQSKRSGQPFGLVMCDLDGLKKINDYLGHRAGDSALKTTANKIKQALREHDTFSRLGGDEFGIIVSSIANETDLDILCQRIHTLMQDELLFEEKVLKLRISLGYSMYPKDGSEIGELIENADQKMYANKKSKTTMN